MQRTKQYRRFPRTAFALRVGRIMDEVWKYRLQAADNAEMSDSPALTARLRERESDLDNLWHDLEAAQRTLQWMR